MKRYLVSTGTLPMCVGKQFTDYVGIFEALKLLDVDGIELVFLPEWDASLPPVTPTSANWADTPKITTRELVGLVLSNGVFAPVVHVNRDVGNMLCTTIDEATILRGQRILEDNLIGASRLGSKIAVLHLWDTRCTHLDLRDIFDKVYVVSKDFEIRLAMENVPISDKSLDVTSAWFRLANLMPPNYGFTLDLNWCSLYDDFFELLHFENLLLNVHVQGLPSKTEGGQFRLVPRTGGLDIKKSLFDLNQAGYNGYLTLEMNKPTAAKDFVEAIKMIKEAGLG